MYDLAIIGAGPAGATLARLCADRYRVLLLDRRPLDRAPVALLPGPGPTKCCGGLVAPDAQRELARLGVGLPGSVLVGPQLFAVRSVDLGSGRQRIYQRHYINVDRERFDRWLVSLVPPGVDRRFGSSLRGFRIASDRVELSVSGQRRPIAARMVVGADGAGSRVRRLCRDAPAIAGYVAVQEWREVRRTEPYFGAVFDPAATDFYAWTIPKGDYLLVGAALPPGRDARARFERLLGALDRAGFELGRRVRGEGARLCRPRHPGQLYLGRGRVALIGEAAGWISPSSAEGMSYAFASARLFGRSLRWGLAGAVGRYRRAAWSLAATLLAKNLKSRVMYSPPLRGAILATGLGSVDVAVRGVLAPAGG